MGMFDWYDETTSGEFGPSRHDIMLAYGSGVYAKYFKANPRYGWVEADIDLPIGFVAVYIKDSMVGISYNPDWPLTPMSGGRQLSVGKVSINLENVEATITEIIKELAYQAGYTYRRLEE